MMNDLIKTLLLKVRSNAQLDISRLEKEKIKLEREIMAIESRIENKKETVGRVWLIEDARKNNSASEDEITEMIEDLVL